VTPGFYSEIHVEGEAGITPLLDEFIKIMDGKTSHGSSTCSDLTTWNVYHASGILGVFIISKAPFDFIYWP
jgi:hypothetical protein